MSQFHGPCQLPFQNWKYCETLHSNCSPAQRFGAQYLARTHRNLDHASKSNIQRWAWCWSALALIVHLLILSTSKFFANEFADLVLSITLSRLDVLSDAYHTLTFCPCEDAPARASLYWRSTSYINFDCRINTTSKSENIKSIYCSRIW